MNRAIMKQQWDRVLAIVAALVGVVLLVVGWVQVSSTAVVAEQIPYLASQCVGGLIAFALRVAARVDSLPAVERQSRCDHLQAICCAGGRTAYANGRPQTDR